MAQEKEENKKIIIDQDWKEEAKREKEKLAAQEQAETTEAKDQAKGRGPLPEGDFSALVSMLATQTMFALGAIQLEEGENREPDLELAKYNIDMLGALETKTKGNLESDEQKMITGALSQLRMLFVQISG